MQCEIAYTRTQQVHWAKPNCQGFVDQYTLVTPPGIKYRLLFRRTQRRCMPPYDVRNTHGTDDLMEEAETAAGQGSHAKQLFPFL
jgi:hypothetical protein